MARVPISRGEATSDHNLAHCMASGFGGTQTKDVPDSEVRNFVHGLHARHADWVELDGCYEEKTL